MNAMETIKIPRWYIFQKTSVLVPWDDRLILKRHLEVCETGNKEMPQIDKRLCCLCNKIDKIGRMLFGLGHLLLSGLLFAFYPLGKFCGGRRKTVCLGNLHC